MFNQEHDTSIHYTSRARHRKNAHTHSHSIINEDAGTILLIPRDIGRCEALLLVGYDEAGEEIREQCEAVAPHHYLTSEGIMKQLCSFHYAFMDQCKAADAQGGAA